MFYKTQPGPAVCFYGGLRFFSVFIIDYLGAVVNLVRWEIVGEISCFLGDYLVLCQ